LTPAGSSSYWPAATLAYEQTSSLGFEATVRFGTTRFAEAFVTSSQTPGQVDGSPVGLATVAAALGCDVVPPVSGFVVEPAVVVEPAGELTLASGLAEVAVDVVGLLLPQAAKLRATGMHTSRVLVRLIFPPSPLSRSGRSPFNLGSASRRY
jgi:hypothetical protein